MKDNATLLLERIANFNARKGPRVGDYIQLPRLHPKLGEFTRLTHDWDDHIQTGGMSGSYYFTHSGFLSYSGGLDPGVSRDDITIQIAEKPGSVWFFDGEISGAGRGVEFTVPMRVFALRDGAKLDGIDELRCPFHLIVLDKAGHERTCNYWFLVQHRAQAHRAFTTAEQLMNWLPQAGLMLTKPLSPAGEHDFQSLAYAPVKETFQHGAAVCA